MGMDIAIHFPIGLLRQRMTMQRHQGPLGPAEGPLRTHQGRPVQGPWPCRTVRQKGATKRWENEGKMRGKCWNVLDK